jgi:hypothetical protein
MSRNSSRCETRHVEQVMRGVAAGVLGAVVMNLFARAVAVLNNGAEADGAAPGGDRAGRGVQPPQADGRAAHDATVRVGTIAYRAVTGDEPSRSAQPWLGSAAHYGFSATVGVCYALLAPRVPVIRRGFGTVYGTLVWALADEGVVPALGLSRSPRELPLGVHLYALFGHWVYGATLEAVTRQEPATT